MQCALEIEACRMKNFIVLCLIIGSAFGQWIDELSQEQSDCIKQAEAAELTEDSTICKKVFENLKSDYTNYVLSSLALEDDSECISSHLQKIQKLYLKGLIEHIRSGKSKAEFKAITDASTRKMITKIQLLCSTTVQEEYFNRIYTAVKESAPTPESLQCSQKYLIDKKVIDPADYNIDPSIETSTDCEQLNKNTDDFTTFGDDEDRKMYSSLFGLTSSKGFECLLKEFSAEKVHLKFYAFGVIVQSGWMQDMVKLKNYHTKWQIKIAKIILDCMMEMSS